MEEKIKCKKHFEEYAENFCEECNEFICPYCALSINHFSHINKIKSIEDIIKQKIKIKDSDNNLQNISLNKTIKLFQFIINYNTMYFPFDNSYIINSIDEECNKLIGKIVELKMKIKKIFFEKNELITNILKTSKNAVLETQHKILDKINEKDNNNNEYLNKINLCLEKIRLNKNPNDEIKFITEYQNLINNCFENEEDLNKKYNLYLAYKYLNEISSNFKDKCFDKLIQPCFKSTLTKICELVKQLDIEEKKDYEKLKNKINELNIETSIKDRKKLLKNRNENIIIENKNKENKIAPKIEPEIKKEQKEIIDNNNLNDKKIEEKKIENNNQNMINIEKLEEKEDIKKKLADLIKRKKTDKNDNLNILFEPPKIEF